MAGPVAQVGRTRLPLNRAASTPSVARWPPDPANTSSPTHRRRAGPAPTAPPAREPSHAERCRTLVHGERRGALSTLAADPAGYPFGSVVSFGLADDGDPLFFVSLMAEHTQNALRDPRASLLVAEPVPEGADPLASGRVTLLGLLAPVDDDGPRRGPGALPRRQPGGVLLHRLRRLHLPAPRGRPRPLRRWLRADELGRRRRLRRRRARSLGRRRGRDHPAHERRPRRGAGAVLPPLRAPARHGRRRRCRRSTATASTWSRSAPTTARRCGSRSRRSARPATRSARRWSRWWPRRARPADHCQRRRPRRAAWLGSAHARPTPALGTREDRLGLLAVVTQPRLGDEHLERHELFRAQVAGLGQRQPHVEGAEPELEWVDGAEADEAVRRLPAVARGEGAAGQNESPDLVEEPGGLGRSPCRR